MGRVFGLNALCLNSLTIASSGKTMPIFHSLHQEEIKIIPLELDTYSFNILYSSMYYCIY